jgi:hypothetical protein
MVRLAGGAISPAAWAAVRVYWKVRPESSCVGAGEGVSYSEAKGGGGSVTRVSGGESGPVFLGCRVPEWVICAIGGRSKDGHVVREMVTPDFGLAIGVPFERPEDSDSPSGLFFLEGEGSDWYGSSL